MPKHLYLILISTFIFGMVSGAVLFLYNNTGGEGDGGIGKSSGMSVTVETYGGCERRGCASYRIEENGDYTYIVRSTDEKNLRFEDSLSSTERRALLSKIKGTDIKAIQNSQSVERCAATFDGLSYRYDIVYKDASYSFDSCEEDTSNVPLFEVLNEYFELFNRTHGTLE